MASPARDPRLRPPQLMTDAEVRLHAFADALQQGYAQRTGYAPRPTNDQQWADLHRDLLLTDADGELLTQVPQAPKRGTGVGVFNLAAISSNYGLPSDWSVKNFAAAASPALAAWLEENQEVLQALGDGERVPSEIERNALITIHGDWKQTNRDAGTETLPQGMPVPEGKTPDQFTSEFYAMSDADSFALLPDELIEYDRGVLQSGLSVYRQPVEELRGQLAEGHALLTESLTNSGVVL